MAGSVFVLAEQWNGRLSEITYEALALGREVADQLLAPLEVVLLGHHARQLARSLGGAGTVLYLDHPLLAEPVPEVCAQALAPLIQARAPRCVLVPSTIVSPGIGALLADQLAIPSVDHCRDLRVVDGGYEATCLLFGGKIEVVVKVERSPAVFGIRPGARPQKAARTEWAPLIEDVTTRLLEVPPVRLRRYVPAQGWDVDITQKDVLVSVGRGIQGRDNLPLAERLAKALGGAVCGSRIMADQGWLPLSRQIGSSGATVKPKLYVAVGISGAPEHVVGMRHSGLVIAINTDARAPIFDYAHYGVVADALELLPVFTEAIESGRNQGRGAGRHASSPGATTTGDKAATADTPSGGRSWRSTSS